MNSARSFALFSMVLLSPSLAQAGPWVKEPGKAYVKVSASTFSTDQVVDANGNHTTTPWTYTNHSVTTFLDVGVAPRVGLNLTVPFHVADNSYESLKYQRSGLGDLGLGINVAALTGRCPLSVEIGGSIPLYDGIIPSDAELTGATGGTDPSQRYLPMLGDGAYEFHPGVSIGCSFYPVPAWATAKISYSLRSDGFGDGIKSGFGAGGFVWPDRVALIAGIDAVQRFSGEFERPTKSYMSVYTGFLVRIGWGFSAEATIGHIPSGVFVAKGTTYSLGISFDGKLFPDPY